MRIHDPDNRWTIMISPKELADKLGIEGEIVSIFIRKGHGKKREEHKIQERIEMKIIKEIKNE